MTPGRLDPTTVQRRLVELTQLAARLREVVPVDAQALEHDWRTRAIVERLFEQLVQLAVAINAHVVAAQTGVAPEDYRTGFVSLGELDIIEADLAERLANAAGMCSTIVHDHLRADPTLVAKGVTAAPDDFDAYVHAVATWLQEQDSATRRSETIDD